MAQERNSWDAIIVGGGPAGLSAALVLGRCRRRVLVCDAGQPRNRHSQALHAYLTRDGVPPVEFLETARDGLSAYPTVEFRTCTVEEVAAVGRQFEVRLADGTQLRCRKLLLAT
ncbi:MAG TPA: FAD-dependent oxidoreductase, partial [Steroidobacteraceae bacterium]|nr:FAD-dependent oxidoreductase [Steroidobacteraceae bacterium]